MRKVRARVQWDKVKHRVCPARYGKYRWGIWHFIIEGNTAHHYPDCAWFNLDEIEILEDITLK